MSLEKLTLPYLSEPVIEEIRGAARIKYGVVSEADLRLLIATVGLPRAGKSTWARLQGVPMVNPDNIRLAMHGRPFIKELEELVWWHVKLMVKSLFYAGHQTVILDACLSSEHRRLPWGTCELWCTAYTYFPTTEEVCRERALKDSRTDLLDPIRQQAKVLTPPGSHEGGLSVLIQ